MQEYIEIARRLGGLREAMGLEIADLAAQTGVEAEKVGAYESGMVEIPVGYLLKVAQVCEVDMTALLSGADAHLTSHSLVRNGKGLSVERRTDYDYRDLAYRFKGKKMQPFEITVGSKVVADMHFTEHTGQEFIYCLEGVLEVRLAENAFEMNPGDSLYFDSRTPHAMRAVSDVPARFIDVIL